MKLNEVKYLPKTNAVADVYTEATGMPIIGELMAVAAGLDQEDENEEPEEPSAEQ